MPWLLISCVFVWSPAVWISSMQSSTTRPGLMNTRSRTWAAWTGWVHRQKPAKTEGGWDKDKTTKGRKRDEQRREEGHMMDEGRDGWDKRMSLNSWRWETGGLGGWDGWRLQRWKDIKSKAFKVKVEGRCKGLEVSLFLAVNGTKAKSILVSMTIYIRVEVNLNLSLIMLIMT